MHTHSAREQRDSLVIIFPRLIRPIAKQKSKVRAKCGGQVELVCPKCNTIHKLERSV